MHARSLPPPRFRRAPCRTPHLPDGCFYDVRLFRIEHLRQTHPAVSSATDLVECACRQPTRALEPLTTATFKTWFRCCSVP
eukprot:324257-Chlamydomonas_euryale.AAC.2